MKIAKITPVGRKRVFDISIDSEDYDRQQYALENRVISHNTGLYYSADTIWIIGRRQEKEGTEITGYDFVINIEKSRYVREKSSIPISVRWNGGINMWSGLFDLAIEMGYITSAKKGWYNVVDSVTGEVGSGKRKKDLEYDGEFWKKLFNETDFKLAIEQRFAVGQGPMEVREGSYEVHDDVEHTEELSDDHPSSVEGN